MLQIVRNGEAMQATHNVGDALIAVDESAAQEAGAVVFFQCAAADAAPLEVAAVGAGLPRQKLPDLPSAEVALHRAVDELKTKRRMVRPVEGGGWAIVVETIDAAGVPNGYDENNKLVVRRSLNKLVFSPDDHALCSEVSTAFAQQRARYAAADISAWLIGLCAEHDGVSPRARGGLYFIPRQRLDAFRAWTKVLHAATEARVFFIPAMKSEEAVEAILSAITREAESEAEAMENALNAHADALTAQVEDATSPLDALDAYRQGQTEGKKALGKRAIGSKLRSLTKLGSKLATYEELLGVRLEVIRERLERVRAGLTVASIAVEDGGRE